MPDEVREDPPTGPSQDLPSELPRLPGDFVTLPQGSSRVLDADEEVFILYSRHFENRDEDGIQGLGSVNSLAGTLSLSFTLSSPEIYTSPGNPKSKGRSRHRKASNSKSERAEKTIEIEVFQDITGLRSRKGDTGSVVWRASVHLAKLLLQQYYFPPQPPHSAILNPERLANSRIVELGSGTGVLGCALLPLLSGAGHITLTDLPELTPLLRKNAKSARVSVEPLDWTWQILPEFAADLVLCVDCIYNTALVRPLVRVLGTLDAPILVVIELRDEDVVREFLNEWLEWRPHTVLASRLGLVGKRSGLSLLDEEVIGGLSQSSNGERTPYVKHFTRSLRLTSLSDPALENADEGAKYNVAPYIPPPPLR